MLYTLVSKTFAGLALSALALSSFAQNFPTKPVTMIVAYPAGGASDFVARLYSKEMPALLGQPVLVENVPGAGGTIGLNKAFNAPADGHTLVLSSPLETILAPLAYKSAQYKAESWRTVLLAGRTDTMLITRPSLSISTVTQLLDLMKANDAKPLSYCSVGVGSLYHLMTEKFIRSAGVQALHVPYSGFPQCMQDIAGGSIDFAFLPVGGPFPGMVEKGILNALAISGTTPSPKFPHLPLLKDRKEFKDFTVGVWAGLHVHGKTPERVVQKLVAVASTLSMLPSVRASLEATGATLLAKTPSAKDMHAQYLKEIKLYTELANSVGLVKQ